MLKIITICFFPLIVLFAQMISPLIAIIAGFVLLVGAISLPTFRKIFLIFSFMVFGYLIWKYIAENVLGILNLSPNLTKVLNRFGLLGYILIFAVWHKIQTPENTLFKIGNSKEIICIPFIWNGFKEIVWRFTLIFSLLWLFVAVIFSVKNGFEYGILLYGVPFSVVNALLEEFIWRGFILSRLIEITTEKMALIVSSLAFGLYHYSLNFPLLICFIFAIGGFLWVVVLLNPKGFYRQL